MQGSRRQLHHLGRPYGSAEPGSEWQVVNNYAAGNYWGYLVIDGAHHNTLNNNAAAGNAVYDLEMVGDSLRFGFPTPPAHDNAANIGAYRDMKVKDCGINNRIVGGTPVDITQDPCY